MANRKGLIFTLLLMSSSLLSCSSLQTPEFKTAKDYFNPKESYTNRNSTSVSDNIALSWPVTNVRVNRGFKQNKKRKHRHLGIDFGGTRGTPILSAHDGRIIYAGTAFRGYGKLVILENPKGFATFYAHLNEILVKEGQYVSEGKMIGKMGRTGRATGVHLHFELRIASLPVDPHPFFSKNVLDRTLAQERK